mgnify:CR=1 FL=1
MSKREQKRVAKMVAKAIAKVSPLAGQAFCDSDKIQSVTVRAANMLREVDGHGVYIAPGDPHGWSHDGALATIYMEPKGGHGDCIMPLDYYGEYGPAADMVVDKAREHMAGYWISFVNPGVAVVYPELDWL